MKTEYVRNLHSNYVRLALEGRPEEKRYQYCILSRGGIRGLLPASLRYLDGEAYLYYDITSKQSLVQLHQKGNVSREWFLDFMASFQRLRRELERFLLQEDNVIWDPRHVFQDLENNVFSFLYVPYYEGENQFLQLLSFLVEKIDYEDTALVECIYKMYEQLEKNGVTYLQDQIFRDAKVLEESGKVKAQETVMAPRSLENNAMSRVTEIPSEEAEGNVREEETVQEKRGIMEQEALPKKRFGLFDNRRGRRAKEQEKREEYQLSMQQVLNGYAVAETSGYEEEYGRTAFIYQKPEKKEGAHRLYHVDGRKASELNVSNLLIGKQKDRVDLYLADDSVSRMHARILKEQDAYYLEDENSTNGTFQNKMRLLPYERRKLEPGDELQFGNVTLFFR